MSAASLEQALVALGIAAKVEATGGLALLRVRDVRPLADDATRALVIAAGADHGYTHVAVELDGGDAAFHRD
ncbi:MAG: hypothetical protein M3081_06720 [Gemmatimonadota bacterium]|nr:hypothetical protein [Gemmatimonadota bacterium]